MNIGLKEWLRTRRTNKLLIKRTDRINKLLIEHAGLHAEDDADMKASRYSPHIRRRLGEIVEELRQLEFKETP